MPRFPKVASPCAFVLTVAVPESVSKAPAAGLSDNVTATPDLTRVRISDAGEGFGDDGVAGNAVVFVDDVGEVLREGIAEARDEEALVRLEPAAIDGGGFQAAHLARSAEMWDRISLNRRRLMLV